VRVVSVVEVGNSFRAAETKFKKPGFFRRKTVVDQAMFNRKTEEKPGEFFFIESMK
jgi:hypothetical protein